MAVIGGVSGDGRRAVNIRATDDGALVVAGQGEIGDGGTVAEQTLSELRAIRVGIEMLLMLKYPGMKIDLLSQTVAEGE